MMDIMELSRKIVETFYLKRKKSEDYVIQLWLEPNPLNFDGCDSTSARVVCLDRIDFDWNVPKIEIIVLESGYAKDIEDALIKLAIAAGVPV